MVACVIFSDYVKLMQRQLVLLAILKQLLLSLFNFNGILTLCSFTLITLKSLSAGLTFLMIIPLLELVGLSVLGNHPSTHARFHDLFNFFHIPETLVGVLSLFTIMLCSSAGIAYLEQHASTRLQQRYNQFLRTHLQRSLLCSSWSFLRSQKKSDLVHLVITETHQLALCNHQLLILINQLFLIGVNTTIAFFLSWSMTLFAVGSATFLFALMFPLHRNTVNAGEKHLQINQELHQVISQQLYGIKSIKGSGFEPLSVAAFEKTGQTLEKLSTQLHMGVARNRLFNTTGSAIAFSLLLYVALEIFGIPIQQLTLLLIIYARILPLVSNARQIYQRVLHQVPAYQHITELLKKTAQHQESIDTSIRIPFEQEIRGHKVSFNYPHSNKKIIQGMNFQLKKNTSTLVLGPSGVGKTTLVDLICGLAEPTAGEIYIDKQLLTPTNAHAWRKQIAYITQDIFLFNATIRENLLWFSTETAEAELYYALELASADFVYHLPAGLDTQLGDNGVTLSGGERQRLALARAILQKPQLLILDESTNSLDGERAQHIQHTLALLKGMMTIVMISHQPVNMAMIDQVIRLESEPVLEPRDLFTVH